MAFIRPELTAALHRGREVIAAAAVAVFGLWVVSFGGLFLGVIGGVIAALGLGLGIIGLRRMRFAQSVSAPGLVEVVEGQISYFGPVHGGFAALSDLSEISLAGHRGERAWRLRQHDGQVLFIPVAAEGAERLFDAFSGLPGLETPALLAALEAPPEVARIVWRRRGPRRLH